MKLKYQEILDKANELYAIEKTKHIPQEDLAYIAPEFFPIIESQQVKCMLKAIVETINNSVIKLSTTPS